MARKKKTTSDAQRRMMTWTGILILAVGLAAGGAVVGAVKIWRGIMGMSEFRVNPTRVELTQPWMRPEMMREDFVRTDPTGILSQYPSIFESDLSARVSQAYKASPWVRGVPEVRKVFPNRLEIRLDMREPFAVLVSGQRRCCVDCDGVVLSPDYYQLTQDVLDTLGPEVSLPDDVAAPIAGYVWDDVAVEGGLEMFRLCREQFDEDVGVKRIEIATSPGMRGSQYPVAELVLDAGSRVRWGRVPVGPASPSEISTEQKAETLRTVVHKEGENLRRLGMIDVRLQPTLTQSASPSR